MEIGALITEIRNLLTGVSSEVDSWFDREPGLRDYRPAAGGWTINEILEHIALTNHYLLILIDKGTRKALLNVKHLDLQAELEHYIFHRDRLDEVGVHQSFPWMRPEHMEPHGLKQPGEVRLQLKEQLARCLHNLDQLAGGEGVLYKTTMTVNNLGKIDVYEYIYFLGQHARRHVTQMNRNELEYKSITSRA